VLEGREVETAVIITIVGHEIVPLLAPVVELGMLGVETEAIITVIVMMMKCR